MNSNANGLDDLTKITGIGENRQNWLRQSFNIRTFQDLASLTVAQIEEKMKLDGLIVSRKAIEAWLVQAGELASLVDETSQLTEKLPVKLPAGMSNSMPRENGWKPIASFVVEYQIRNASEQLTGNWRTVAHHMEEDRTRTWPGFEGRQLYLWIFDQIPGEFARNQEEEELLQPAQSREASVAGKSATAVKITQLRILQPANLTSPVQAIDPGMQFQASVLRKQPFSFEVEFELAGPKAEEVVRNKIGWSAETRTFDLASRTSPKLCDSGPKSFEKGRLKYQLNLPEISLQEGTHHVWVLITTERSSLALPDFIDIPKLLVV
jgi:hypothetical protein